MDKKHKILDKFPLYICIDLCNLEVTGERLKDDRDFPKTEARAQIHIIDEYCLTTRVLYASPVIHFSHVQSSPNTKFLVAKLLSIFGLEVSLILSLIL